MADEYVEELYSSETPAPYWVFRSQPDQAPKTIVVCGAPNEATEFAASIVASLGVPFMGGEEEAKLWRDDVEGFTARCRDFDRRQEVWAFNHPTAVWDFDRTLATVRNPHFVVALKEPLSVAMRMDAGQGQGDNGRPVAVATKKVLKLYLAAVSGAARTEAPAMLISYDRAGKDRTRAAEGIADFLGVTDYDPAVVLPGVEEDGDGQYEASTIANLRRSGDWRKRLIGRLLERMD